MTILAKPRISHRPGLVALSDSQALPPRAPLPAFMGNRVSTRNVNLNQFA